MDLLEFLKQQTEEFERLSLVERDNRMRAAGVSIQERNTYQTNTPEFFAAMAGRIPKPKPPRKKK